MQGGGLAEDAVDVKPGSGDIKDMPGDASRLEKLGGDMGTVKGPGLGSVVGGVDAKGGVGGDKVSEQVDNSKLTGERAE